MSNYQLDQKQYSKVETKIHIAPELGIDKLTMPHTREQIALMLKADSQFEKILGLKRSYPG